MHGQQYIRISTA